VESYRLGRTKAGIKLATLFGRGSLLRQNPKVLLAKAAEIRTMDAIYLLMLAGLYVVTHGLVLALNRLGKTP
jgi:hypothetical protein